ncbi:hypothetical protein AKJ16_DCAP15824 [Drosera capensis]
MLSSLSSPTLAMTGALAWRVNLNNKRMIFGVWGRSHGIRPGSYPLCLSLPPFLLLLARIRIT